MATEIFVYGTLRPTEPNFKRYLGHEGARLIAKDVYTWPEYALVSLGGFPGMVIPDEANQDAVTTVIGDVFEVDSPTLMALDRLEGVPRFYQRYRVRLANGMEPQAYILNPEHVPANAPVIKHGDWIRYYHDKKPSA
jgi:gamma-glutamylcyclotransferase (GGCT)/AIG2-like uncharacterized protein YtfP